MPPKLEEIQKNQQEVAANDTEKVAVNDSSFNPKDKELEQFKASVKAGASSLMEKTSSLFKRAGGAVVEVGWKSLFAGVKDVKRTAEDFQTAGRATVEGAQATGRAVRSGAEYAVGAGAMAVEKTIEVGQATITKGQEVVRAGKERVVELVETTKERAIDAKNKVGLAIESAKDAAITKTVEGVENAKMVVRSGIEATTAYGASVYEKAKGKMTGAWEAMKQKVNDIKRQRAIAEITRKLEQADESVRIAAEHAQGKLQEANALRTMLSQLTGTYA